MAPARQLERLRKKQIINAGLSVIRDKRLANTTLDAVCRESGLSKGGMVHYFPTKRKLFNAIFAELFQRASRKINKKMLQSTDVVEKIHAFTWFFDDSDTDVCLVHTVTIDIMSFAIHDPYYAELHKNSMAYLIKILSSALSQGIEDEFFNPMNTRDTAQSILAVCFGIGTRWFLLKEFHSADWAMRSYENAAAGLLLPYRTNRH